ncbi:MAG: WD40 repeat domain-containing protein, partial [Planctomycetota bacterium]|nr:WD40 repeat domain-containing protein [Planctomycetota bacterium]
KADAALEMSLRDARDKLAAAALARSAAQAAFKAIEIHLKDAEAEAGNYAAARTQNQSAVVAAGAAAAGAKVAQDRATAEASATRKLAAAHKLQPLAVRFSEDAETVAVVLGDGSLRIWAVASGLPVSRLPVVGTTTSAALEACEDGGFVASGADGSTARMSTTARWFLERTLGGETAASPFVDRVNALRVSPDGKMLAAGGGEPTRSGDISLWDVESGKLIRDWKDRHADTVLSLDFSPDGKRLASGGADKIARVVEVPSGKLVHVFEGHTHHVLGVSFRADGRILGTSGADGVLVVWDMISGERKRRIEAWSKEVTSLQFLGATNQILTSAGDNVIRIVDDGGRQIRAMSNLRDFMQSAAAAGDFVVAGGEDGLLRVWSGTNGQELAVFGADSNARRP